MTRNVQGWRAGVPFPLVVVEVDPGQWLEPSAAAALEKARAAFGRPVRVVSGYRTQEEQQRLWDAWWAYKADPTHAPKANRAAQPGHSNHQDGTAGDLAFDTETDREDFAAGPARDAGFIRPVVGEPWHFHFIGAP